MADEALKKLDEQLNCSICFDLYTDPKLLQCFHIFCQHCLEPLVVRDQQDLPCPTCRQFTPIGGEGVAGLQSAFHINHLLEIRKSFQVAEDRGAASEEVDGSALGATSSNRAVRFCSVHAREEVKLFCGTCNEVVCYKCALKGGNHQNHDYEEINQAFEKYKKDITPSLEPMAKQVATIRKALAYLETHRGEVSEQRASIEYDIHNSFSQLQEALNIRKIELLITLHRITHGKLCSIVAQRDQMETTLAQLLGCLRFVRGSLQSSSKVDVLMTKENTASKVQELTTPLSPDFLKPCTDVDMMFLASDEMVSRCQKHGLVLASGAPDPSKCHVTGKGVEVAVVGERATVTLQAVNFKDRACEELVKSFECVAVSEITHAKTSCSVERTGLSRYEISYRPTIKGRHHLHIKVEWQHIRGSPFSVPVISPVEALGTPILVMRDVEKPWGVAINQRGEVVVTRGGRHCIFIFSPSGEKLRSFGLRGSGRGQLQNPRGVTTDVDGNILVADYGNHRVQKFSPDGFFLRAAGSFGNGPLQFSYPTDLAFNTSNNMVYVMDRDNHRVQVLNSNLTFYSTFGREGSAKGEFIYPYGIDCDSTGMVYVADSFNHRIQVFTADGKPVRMFGRRGQARGVLGRPYCIAIDTGSGIMYVSEGDNYRVSVFTSEGKFVTSFGHKGEAPGQFKGLYGLAVDSCGVVYVCDDRNNRVQVF